MIILVTGGLGFIGHNVVQRLETLGHEVVITDTRTTYGIIDQNELDRLIVERTAQIRTNLIYSADVASASASWLVERHRPELIIHLASFPRQKVVNANPMLGSRVMSEGLLNLLEASVKHSVGKFVYVSSSMVYGDFTELVSEDAVCRPHGQYGIMKLAGEWLVRDYTKKTNGSLAHTILRPSAVYGPRDVKDRVISKFLATAMQGGVLKVNGANETLDFTYVDDAADGIVAAALSANSNNKTYNITLGQGVSLLSAAKKVTTLVGQGSIECHNKDSNYPSRSALNINAAQQDFNYSPKVDLDLGLNYYYQWLLANEHRD